MSAVRRPELTALVGTFARVLLAAGGNATLKADALAAATCRQGETRLGCRTGRCFAISFGDDFVAHLVFQEKKVETPYLNIFFLTTLRPPHRWNSFRLRSFY